MSNSVQDILKSIDDLTRQILSLEKIIYLMQNDLANSNDRLFDLRMQRKELLNGIECKKSKE